MTIVQKFVQDFTSRINSLVNVKSIFFNKNSNENYNECYFSQFFNFQHWKYLAEIIYKHQKFNFNLEIKISIEMEPI